MTVAARGCVRTGFSVVLSACMVFGTVPAQALAEAIDGSEAEAVEQVLEDEGDELPPDTDEASSAADAGDEDGEPLADADEAEAAAEDEYQTATADTPVAGEEPATDDAATVEAAEEPAPEAEPEEPAGAPAEDEPAAPAPEGEPEEPAAEDADLAAQSTGKVLADMDLSSAAVTLSASAYTYNGARRTPAPTVVLDGVTLTKGTHYTVSYKNNVNVGTATVTIKAKSPFTGSQSVTFKINKASVAKATTSKIATQKYDGTARKPSPTVKVGTRTLRKDTDYTLSYKSNTRPGTATVTITGKGNYKGTKSVTFKVAAMAGTWRQSGGRWWYEWRDGTYPKGVFLAISGKTYRFDASGWMLTGWQQVGGKWYYLGSDGAMVKSKWVGNYYLGKGGAMLTSCETSDGWLVGKDGACTGKATYKVAFKANGGTGTMSAQTVQRCKATALKANAFKRGGYAFAGWNTKADGSGKAYKNRQQVKNLTTRGKTVTLYAQWKKGVSVTGFSVPYPSYWNGKVSASTGSLSGYNVGTLTDIVMSGGSGLVTIHCAKTSEYKEVTGWGDVCLIGTKKGKTYTVAVYMDAWPWMCYDILNLSSEQKASADAALTLLTGGAYTTCGNSSSQSYADSYAAAQEYVKKNIFNQIVVD